MASIETYATPTWLYRYRSLRAPGADGDHLADPNKLERELGAIEQGYIWTSTYKRLNDPMEGFYHSSSLVRDQPGYDQYVRSEKLGLGIASFSESWDNELMWAHYADGFRGICVVYKMSRLLSGLAEVHKLSRVAYGDKPHFLNLKTMKKEAERARAILSTKTLKWSYEREWRLFTPAPQRADHGEGAVASVFLGMRMARQDRETIAKRLEARGINVRPTRVEGYSVAMGEPGNGDA